MSLFLYGGGIVAILIILILGVEIMAISTAVQKGNMVYVYDEKGKVLFTRLGKLQGYTSDSVSIETTKSTLSVFDPKNRVVKTVHL